jgi:signal peptidase I
LIGLPDETVHEDATSHISINGKRLSEPYIKPGRLHGDTHRDQTWKLPTDSYFLMGDNRASSCDSRVWGSVAAREIIGKVVKIVRQG